MFIISVKVNTSKDSEVDEIVLFYLGTVEKDDSQIIQIECNACPVVLLYLFPECFHLLRIADALNNKESSSGGSRCTKVKHLLHKLLIPIMVQIQKIDRRIFLQKELRQIGSTHIIGFSMSACKYKNDADNVPASTIVSG